MQCKEQFDAARLPHYVVKFGGNNRYLHAKCGEDYFASHKDKKNDAELFNPETDELCPFCKKKINIEKDLYRTLPGGWHAHEACALIEDQKEKTPEQELDLYIMKRYDIPFVTPYMKKLIEKYKDEYQYTYTGMLRSLQYWYEVKKMPFDKKKGVGIIPYIYQEAYNYYHSIWLANQKSEDNYKYVPQVEEVTIRRPPRPTLFKKLFSSVDKDEVIDE